MKKEMSKQVDMNAFKAEHERMSHGFHSIGAFLFQFSQMEFTIRAMLGGLLNLTDEQFDIVTAPYDFAMLCTVTKEIYLQTFPHNADKINKLFNEFRELNDARVRVAHGVWTDNGASLVARHVSRNKLREEYHFKDPKDLEKLRDKAQELMQRLLFLPSNNDSNMEGV